MARRNSSNNLAMYAALAAAAGVAIYFAAKKDKPIQYGTDYYPAPDPGYAPAPYNPAPGEGLPASGTGGATGTKEPGLPANFVATANMTEEALMKELLSKKWYDQDAYLMQPSATILFVTPSGEVRHIDPFWRGRLSKDRNAIDWVRLPGDGREGEQAAWNAIV
ncbi:MAG: hypothetical protein EOP50_00510 [Sphingobacteriales bacterium]|nr:MAG: hypothetical protein EOP50_00510 [Sphingobacteriales bacterium]